MRFALTAAAALLLTSLSARAQRPLLPIEHVNSAEFGWLQKPVLASRVLDDFTQPSAWKFSGTGTVSSPQQPALGDMRSLRVELQMFRNAPAPNRARLSSVNLQRTFPNEDWSGYNRLSLWVRPDFAGIPVLPLQLVLHNDGVEKVPDRYDREGTHFITFARNGWQQIVWEIDPLARDRVTRLEIGYFVNRMLAGAGDHVAFEIGKLELQKVDPDVHTGWVTGANKIAFSHSGYQSGSSKSAIASALSAQSFELVSVQDIAFGETVLRKPITTVQTRNGTFQQMDFSEIQTPGSYVLRAGGITSKPFAIGNDVWKSSIWKTLNFFYGNRCGDDIPGVHGIDHLDWFATHDSTRLTMSGGWHDAGDLSQGLINTGEATYAMFALADKLAARGDDPALTARLVEEAKWGLDWVLRVRFPGGYRIGFGSHNYWSNNIAGDADDRLVAAKNNPNVNYIASAAAAIGYRVLKDREPALAARALRVAREDWEFAIVGIEGPSTWHTPAFAASRMELAGVGITASLELFAATGEARYRDKAVELARVVMASQQVARVGSVFPLSGFFYTGPDRDTIFHQFHKASDQAPIVALSQLVRALPDHPEWMQWYATIARYAEYQKRGATTTAPYHVLPAYVYRLADSVQVPESGGRYLEKQDQYAAQVRAGMPMGDGWFLRAFPVWFQRRGNYGVLLSQAKALSTASRLRGDSTGLDLAQQQAQWVVGRNPFVQSTMYGEGYDWAQQYSVSSADFVGSLPVGMQSRGTTDLPYWPSQNTYVYKEVWVHSSSRWLWLMEDLLPVTTIGNALSRHQASFPTLAFSSTIAADGTITFTLSVSGTGVHRYELRTDNLRGTTVAQTVTLRSGMPTTMVWTAKRLRADSPYTAVVIEDGNVTRTRDLFAQ
ncbi:glycoside hydrolase family 9 protein [Gemmatimonas sp.]|uniref:glycoside hydrolase family 9 protein n=1 Tax=Gemmatimonas sp. TaxID=1962908 RepID=UPI00286E7951|nr:glycoside hydrolase family 9 protein [Gemmatimonas sp.]